MEAAVVSVECRCVDRTTASSSSEYIELFIFISRYKNQRVGSVEVKFFN